MILENKKASINLYEVNRWNKSKKRRSSLAGNVFVPKEGREEEGKRGKGEERKRGRERKEEKGRKDRRNEEKKKRERRKENRYNIFFFRIRKLHGLL